MRVTENSDGEASLPVRTLEAGLEGDQYILYRLESNLLVFSVIQNMREVHSALINEKVIFSQCGIYIE